MPCNPFYASIKWKNLRKKIRIRDQHTCQKCGSNCMKFKSGVVDHKKSIRKFPELAYEESNLWVLCNECHNSWKRKLEQEPRVKFGFDSSGLPTDPNHMWNKYI